MRKTAFNALLFLALSFAGSALPQEKNFPAPKNYKIEWTYRAAMPGELYAHAAARIGDKIYIIGGRGEKSGFAGYNYVYDISENTWETKESMPSGSSNLAAAYFTRRDRLARKFYAMAP